ncbi:bifunctional methylenetetrahydrofolate dehydrogenase/methenyltetrahydrofolate cyclohydrolase FolD [Ralstonia syzygii]|uniref:Bifunctional protein FolD n=1 Tax=Ralstonia syzygii R24 TaxID=907261 RepID=G3A4D5_9RALS|nr:bifunctional methylenetetrahydrofolate dehydrogenase/methenyltetrahydrofolate cyclohydrolase FolD [Ralstonia syzygii]CCA88770.1 bifunctional: 5,10-methylene-tetrahydrofolate dehydrogenase; 5,10-methylene-tetrahydrofolate cyclohydrolase [Ralstonia syzygii R24]
MAAAKVIDGAALSRATRLEVADRAAVLRAAGVAPGLAVVLVGDDPASGVYVRSKVKACSDAGVESFSHRLPSTVSESELLSLIDELNQDDRVHGILVQLPLPAHIDSHKVLETIDPEKDVDGFHVSNAGALMVGLPLFKPCTPYGVMKMLESEGIKVRGMNAVVLGRSNIVGKPMAMLLLQAGATVTICGRDTKDIGAHTRSADLVVSATGVRGMLTADMVKPGAVVIDVGINRDESNKLCGDVDYAATSQVAGHITPVPGGVGPMTIAMLLVNTIEAAERKVSVYQK